jgi:cell wall-associated NlpC family hydrolase
MGAVLAAAVKTATTTTAKPAAKAAAKTALKGGASRSAARSAANRAAVATKVNAGKEVAIEKGKDAAIRAATKPVDNALSETLSVTADGLLKGILATGIAGVAVVGIAITGYDKMTSSGLGFAPWMLQLMGLNMPGFGFSLPGLPDFGLGGGGVSADGQKIADAAMSYVGKSFKPGVSAQCAVFVRQVLSDAGVNVGVTSAPIDGKSTGPAMANSFYGNDLGTIIKDKGALQPGDIVMFFNTYGNWPARTVTHVGVYVGGGMMVDRPTASRPVQHRSVDTFEFAGALRIPSAEIPSSGGGSAQIDALRRAIIGKESGGNFKAVNPDSGALGYGQLMPSNVGPWTQAALGRAMSPDEFLNNPDAQIATINHKLNEYLSQQLAAGHPEDIAIRRVAAMWYSGQAGLYNDTKPQPYGGTVYESIQSYTMGVLSKYNSYK